MQVIRGDLIQLALAGRFDVIDSALLNEDHTCVEFQPVGGVAK
jgi:hypothetical protein